MADNHQSIEPTRLFRLLLWLFGDKQYWFPIAIFTVCVVMIILIVSARLSEPSADERLVIYQERYDACIAQNIEPESCHDIALRQAGIAK